MEQLVKTVIFADLTDSTGLFESAGNMVATQVITRATHALGQHFARAGGQVVKYLGDGVLVLFDDTPAAVDASIRVKEVLCNLDTPDLCWAALEVKVGIERGPVVEHDGDCYGEAVNVASRLSDLAQPGEILVGESVYDCLPEIHRIGCQSLDRIAIRGKTLPMHVWRIDWVRGAESTLTLPYELYAREAEHPVMQRVDFQHIDQHVELLSDHAPLVIGRGEGVGFTINDRRVSRRHARVEWIGGQCLLTDFSSNGTWVRFAGSPVALVLKRASCTLSSEGEIGLGATPDDFTTPTFTFRVINED